MNYFGIMGIALCGFAVSFIVRQINSPYSVYVSLLTCVVLTAFAFECFEPVISFLKRISQSGNVGSYGDIIIKLTEIGITTAIASGICSDAGERTIAYGIEFVGKGVAALTVLPVLEHLVSSVKNFLLGE